MSAIVKAMNSGSATPIGAVNVTDYPSFAAALAAVVATGGGTLLIPPGTYTDTLDITANVPILVLGYGATLAAGANNTTLVRIKQGVGNTIRAARVSGLVLAGNGRTGVTGVKFEDTDGGTVNDLFIQNCATGIAYANVGAGMWNERTSVADTFMLSCATGISYRVTPGAMPSFNETALRNVGISASTIGIDQGPGVDFSRVTWDNVTIWPNPGGTGVKFDGRLDHSRLMFGIEALPDTPSVTGVHVGATYTNYADAASHDLRISFVGEFADKVLDSSPDGGITWVDGTQHVTSNYQQIFAAWKDGEGFPRFKMNTDGLQFGSGAANPAVSFLYWYADFIKMNGQYVFPTRLSVGTDAEPNATSRLDVGGVVRVGNTAAPGVPTGGGYLYVEAGALKFRGSGGTVTTLGPA